MRSFTFACIGLLAVYANAQTQTIVDVNGNTIVQVVTSDLDGLATTQTLQTLTGTALTPPVPPIPPTTGTPPATATATSNTAVTTAATTRAAGGGGQQGPVGQPEPTVILPSGVTPYTYTTVIDGVTTEVSDNFTPTTPPTQTPQPGPSGTVLGYSEWLSIYGPKSTALAANSNSGWRLSSEWAVVSSSMVVVLGGIWALL